MSFGECLWLLPTATHVWNTVADFPTHVTIIYDICDGRQTFRMSKANILHPVVVHLTGRAYHVSSQAGRFHAIQCDIEHVGPRPAWWPSRAHVSFAYRYDEPFTASEVDAIDARLHRDRIATLVNMELRKCNGHYLNWKRLESHVISTDV